MRLKSRRLRDCAGGESKFNWEYPKVVSQLANTQPRQTTGAFDFSPNFVSVGRGRAAIYGRVTLGLNEVSFSSTGPTRISRALMTKDVASAVSRCPLGT